MSDRTWHLRMHCSYEGEKNKITSMVVEQTDDAGGWKPVAIDISSPGFFVFVYSIFTCQHLYMYVNAAEKGLELASSEGDFHMVTGEDWMLKDLHVSFAGKLRAGQSSPADIDYIQGRMNQCPVSRNLHPSGAHESKLTLSR